MAKGHKLPINTDAVQGYCTQAFHKLQSAPLSSLLCCAIILLMVVTILVWLTAAFGQFIDFDSDDEEESENGTCKEALDGFGLKWDWWLRIAGTLFTLVVFAGCCCGCLMFTVTIDFCPSRVLHVMYCCILIPLFTFVFFFIWIGLGTYMVDKLYTESSDRNTHCKLGKNTTAYLGLMYCYLFALVILAVIYCIYKMAFTLGKRSRKK